MDFQISFLGLLLTAALMCPHLTHQSPHLIGNYCSAFMGSSPCTGSFREEMWLCFFFLHRHLWRHRGHSVFPQSRTTDWIQPPWPVDSPEYRFFFWGGILYLHCFLSGAGAAGVWFPAQSAISWGSKLSPNMWEALLLALFFDSQQDWLCHKH